MGKVKIKNTGNMTLNIGGVICHRNAVSTVEKEALEEYKQTPAGKYVYKNYLEVLSATPAPPPQDPPGNPPPLTPADPGAAQDEPEDDEKTDPPADDENGDDGGSDDPPEFVLDPEIHHIEHRGGGSWFVMEKEDKVYGPLTAEEREKFEAIIVYGPLTADEREKLEAIIAEKEE